MPFFVNKQQASATVAADNICQSPGMSLSPQKKMHRLACCVVSCRGLCKVTPYQDFRIEPQNIDTHRLCLEALS